jgi:NAD/NADP transhydrogenase alpha subunit
MKKSKLLIVGFTLLGVLLVSCNKTKGMLVKSWKVTNVEAKGTISDSIKNVIMSTGNLSFTKDGKVSGNLLGVVSGTYDLSKNINNQGCDWYARNVRNCH